jgi:photosystem II stability/assembly factor-like uncharacterized protein
MDMKRGSDGMAAQNKLLNVVSSLMPLAIIAGLLYAAFFIKPTVSSKAVAPPMFERRDHLYGLAIAQEQNVWVAGSDGKILHTDQAGGAWKWTAQKAGVDTNLQAVAAWDKQRAVAVGNNGVVLVTVDGGAHWTVAEAPKSAVANKLVRVKALADGLGFAIGEYNAVLKTTDNGKTWARLTPDKDVVWYGFDIAGKKLLAAGEFGRILLSPDEGATWQEVQTPSKAHLAGVAFKSEQEAVLVGLNGTVLQTTDSGTHWQVISTNIDEHIYDVIWDGARYVACGDRGLLIVSEDGSKWSALDVGLDATQRNYLWFTQIHKLGQGYLLAGSTLALVENKTFRDLSMPAPRQAPDNPSAK